MHGSSSFQCPRGSLEAGTLYADLSDRLTTMKLRRSEEYRNVCIRIVDLKEAITIYRKQQTGRQNMAPNV